MEVKVFDSKEHANKFYELVKAAKESGRKYSEIAPEAVKDGWQSATGCPVSATMISQFMTRRGYRVMRHFTKGTRYKNLPEGKRGKFGRMTKPPEMDRRTKAYRAKVGATGKGIEVHGHYEDNTTWETEVLEVLACPITSTTKKRLIMTLMQG